MARSAAAHFPGSSALRSAEFQRLEKIRLRFGLGRKSQVDRSFYTQNFGQIGRISLGPDKCDGFIGESQRFLKSIASQKPRCKNDMESPVVKSS